MQRCILRTWVVMTFLAGLEIVSVSSPPPPSPPPLPLPTTSPSIQTNVRTKIVAEVPGLDVGPLVSVRVTPGDTARLPCRHPKPENDTVSLVLWYLNHTSRPFLSYDARAARASSLEGKKSSRSGRGKAAHKMWLEDAGTSLVIQDVVMEDNAEYRCQVHYRLSPTWTQRLLLTVTGSISKFVILDASGSPLEDNVVGPFMEKSSLHLQCRAYYIRATVESLVWMLDGKVIDRKWEEEKLGKEGTNGSVVNTLDLKNLQHRHHKAQLTCRLTTSDPSHSNVAANITDVNIIIRMFRVPDVKLFVEEIPKETQEEKSRKGGGGRIKEEERMGSTRIKVNTRGGDHGGRPPPEDGWEVNEGSSVTFVCSVSADPPAYNVTWLQNGRVVGVGGRRWRRDNSSLVITPVIRSDGGLYNCLASNTEGDGHSNAILLRIAHAPQCSLPAEKNLIVATNTSVNLSCEMDALPKNLTFTWTMADVLPEHGQENIMNEVRGGIITGEDAPPPHHPGLIDLTPDHSSESGTQWLTSSSSSSTGSSGKEYYASTTEDSTGSLLQHHIDASDPTRSVLTLTPTAPVQVLCYAKNSLGRTRIPCSFTISIVDPPEPLRSCNVTNVEVNRIEVRCDDPAPAKDATDSKIVPPVNYSPGISFVRSSDVRTTANIQVWHKDTLVANMSRDRPEFIVENLPAASSLKIVVFAVSPHARSKPVYMFAQTLPRPSLHFTEPPYIHTDFEDFYGDYDDFWDDLDGTMGGVLGGVLGGACAMLIILSGVFLVIWCRQRRRRRRQAASEDEPSVFPSAISSPAMSLSPGGSLAHLDISRPSVYCVSGGPGGDASDGRVAGGLCGRGGGGGEFGRREIGEGEVEEHHESPWFETSVTPLVAPVTSMTPTQPCLETMILEDSTSSDIK